MLTLFQPRWEVAGYPSDSQHAFRLQSDPDSLASNFRQPSLEMPEERHVSQKIQSTLRSHGTSIQTGGKENESSKQTQLTT